MREPSHPQQTEFELREKLANVLALAERLEAEIAALRGLIDGIPEVIQQEVQKGIQEAINQSRRKMNAVAAWASYPDRQEPNEEKPINQNPPIGSANPYPEMPERVIIRKQGVAVEQFSIGVDLAQPGSGRSSLVVLNENGEIITAVSDDDGEKPESTE